MNLSHSMLFLYLISKPETVALLLYAPPILRTPVADKFIFTMVLDYDGRKLQ